MSTDKDKENQSVYLWNHPIEWTNRTQAYIREKSCWAS